MQAWEGEFGDVPTVRRQFEARARSFADHDAVVREAERRMLEKLALMRQAVHTVLDLGCGAGTSREPLLARHAGAQWIGVDLSPGMLATADARPGGWARLLPGWKRGPRGRACASAEQLPLRDASVDLAVSNLMLHWHPRPELVLAELARVLRPGGLLMLSTFGPDTGRELRDAFLQNLSRSRPFPYADMHNVGDALVAAGFDSPVMECEHLTLTYPSAAALLREARALGGNPRPDRMRGLPATRGARAVLAALSARGDHEARVPLTFEIVFGHGWRRAGGTTGAAGAGGKGAAAGDWQAVHLPPRRGSGPGGAQEGAGPPTA